MDLVLMKDLSAYVLFISVHAIFEKHNSTRKSSCDTVIFQIDNLCCCGNQKDYFLLRTTFHGPSDNFQI